jgi:hypothetical protein
LQQPLFWFIRNGSRPLVLPGLNSGSDFGNVWLSKERNFMNQSLNVSIYWYFGSLPISPVIAPARGQKQYIQLLSALGKLFLRFDEPH